MKASVYISSEKIYALEYSHNKVSGFAVEQLPEGSIINGLITDPAQLIECLSEMKRAHPSLLQKAVLVVDGSSVLVKRIEAPKLKSHQYDQLIRDDFAHSTQNADDLVCGYQILKDKTGLPAILACAADITLVDSYIDTFKAAGIELEAIHIGIQAIMNFVAGCDELKGKTYVLNILDGFTLLSMIFDNGKNVLIQRSRLYGEDDFQLADNIRANLSRILQFAKSENFSEITDSYYLGISDETLRLLEAQSMFSNLQLQKLSTGGVMSDGNALPDDAHFVYLNTKLDNTGIDLIQGRRERTKRQRRNRPKKLWLTIPLIITLILAGVVGTIFYLGYRVSEENRQLEDYIYSPEVVEKTDRIAELERSTIEMAEVISQHDRLLLPYQGVVSTPDELIRLATETHSGNVDVISFDFNVSDGILYLSASCLGESVAAKFVNDLRANDAVAEIDYTGYSYRSTGEYDFSIVITLFVEQEEGVAE